mmetsp:Transcript_44090/g.137302  ORF Transcript_44090/g.137302 Transcript_44090/m.137302 type:complete len:200 (-) Transcript_44090:212-811(-)
MLDTPPPPTYLCAKLSRVPRCGALCSLLPCRTSALECKLRRAATHGCQKTLPGSHPNRPPPLPLGCHCPCHPTRCSRQVNCHRARCVGKTSQPETSRLESPCPRITRRVQTLASPSVHHHPFRTRGGAAQSRGQKGRHRDARAASSGRPRLRSAPPARARSDRRCLACRRGRLRRGACPPASPRQAGLRATTRSGHPDR